MKKSVAEELRKTREQLKTEREKWHQDREALKQVSTTKFAKVYCVLHMIIILYTYSCRKWITVISSSTSFRWSVRRSNMKRNSRPSQHLTWTERSTDSRRLVAYQTW